MLEIYEILIVTCNVFDKYSLYCISLSVPDQDLLGKLTFLFNILIWIKTRKSDKKANLATYKLVEARPEEFWFERLSQMGNP